MKILFALLLGHFLRTTALPTASTHPQSLAGKYSAQERAGALSWGSFTKILTLNADGTAEFYDQDVADRDTDFTYNYKGIWNYQDGLVTFKADSKNGKQNYDPQQVRKLRLIGL